MVKKRNTTAAASSTSEGAAAKSSSSLPKGNAPNAPPPAPAPPAPSGSMAKPGDWVASTVTKRDENRSRSLGLISSNAGDVILPDSLSPECRLPCYADVSEAKPNDSWKNILSTDERASAEELFAKFLQIKEADGQTMIGTEVAAVFLKRRIQPAMARIHPMWLYSGPKDETRINAADLSEKELLDEVRRLTSFSQEDSIPLISSYTPLDVDNPPSGILMPSENTHDSPDDTSEGKGSSIPVDFHTMDQIGLEDECNGPMNLEVARADLPSSANNTYTADGSVRNVDADRDAFVDAAADGAKASPAKRSIGGFADEEDLFDIDEGFVEPPPKKAKPDAVSPVVVASEASAPKAAPTAQASTASSLSKGKDISPTAATAAPFSDLRGIISSLEIFASRFTSLEADKVRLQKEVESSSSKLDGAVKIAAAARQEIDSLKEELTRLKRKLKEEEASRLVAEARSAEKDEILCQSSLALLEAANIPVDALDRVPNNSPANAVSTVLASHQLTQELLMKGKSVLAQIHSMIFPKINQEKTLGQLIDTFAVNTKEAIEVFKRTSRTFGAVLAFQLMMGYGFKGDIEEMTKGLPKGQDGQSVDLSTFKASALICARQLLELVFPVPSFADDSSGALPESDRIQRMKDRMTQMEKDLRSTYALAAIINKKSETAATVERYILGELQKATESLNFIALNPAEENKQIHERVHALTQLSSSEEIFWRDQSKTSAVVKFQDRVQQVHQFFDKCYKAMRVVWKTMFPLNAVPPTLLTLMSEFGSAKKSIATGDFQELYPKVLAPAHVIVDRLEEMSKVPEEKETPQG
ncbi:hypothetical protein QYE76_058947 [Lolium multiflorum]|uniref:Uncharacterized protein n=1 Tax=Lolium multiflorum TaxID=4521 RepID=A0AAD8T821_LOLMU|nr:hypothetical protein QYE76_058947 [Lolium multiflorum]